MSEWQTRRGNACLAQIESHWNALRGSRLLPLRSEIDPREMKGALDYCFALERIGSETARFRVAGSHLRKLMGMEVRGAPISSFLTARGQRDFGDLLDMVFKMPATAAIRLSTERVGGRPPIRARMLLLPVDGDLGDGSHVIGALVSDGDIGQAPRCFGIDEIKLSPIVAGESTKLGTYARPAPDRAGYQRLLRAS